MRPRPEEGGAVAVSRKSWVFVRRRLYRDESHICGRPLPATSAISTQSCSPLLNLKLAEKDGINFGVRLLFVLSILPMNRRKHPENEVSYSFTNNLTKELTKI